MIEFKGLEPFKPIFGAPRRRGAPKSEISHSDQTVGKHCVT